MKRVFPLLLFVSSVLFPHLAEAKHNFLLLTLFSSPTASEAPQPTLFVQHAAKVASSNEITILLSSGVLVAISLLVYVIYRNKILNKKFHKLKKELYGETIKLES
ncbi:hypothetical protein [Spongiivirga citrea]|uniref:CcmD family protein n=1 Tax=Spongiivirga citrea TaxID=1481457 RepID=A0A6M0CE62_9FLAO|nr:hypothetical protein [Spongiivirga citrea]NER16116.1 hypothetical protein [Spongiivirga citrea]